MGFMGKIGSKIKERITGKKEKKEESTAEKNLKSLRTIPLLLMGGGGLATILIPVLMIGTVAVLFFAPIDGVFNFFKSAGSAVGGFFEKVGNLFEYGEFSDTKTTYYKQLKDEFENFYEDGVIIDVAFAAAFTNYGRGIPLDADVSCEPSVDEDGTVTGCGGEETDFADMTDEVTILSRHLAIKKDGFLTTPSEEELTEWLVTPQINIWEGYSAADILLLPDLAGISFMERHLKEVNVEIPADAGEKDKFLRKTVKEIFDIKKSYAELANLIILQTTQSGLCPEGIKISGVEEKIPFEQYVAGVVQNEYNSGGIEALKAQAIAARTYALNSTKNCTREIMNSTYAQTYRPATDANVIAATKATDGKIMTYNGEVFSAQYSSFPDTKQGCDVKCDDTTCTAVMTRNPEMNSKHSFTIPKEYLKVYPTDGNLVHAGGHCNGASQQGLGYLADQGKTAEEILKFFYADGIKIELMGGGPGLVAGNKEGFLKRNQVPTPGTKEYFTAANVSYPKFTGQCTWYAYGRALETLAGSDAKWDYAGNAKDWFSYNTSKGASGFKSSVNINEPKAGALIIWGDAGTDGRGQYGHVAFVEEVHEDGTFDYSEANAGGTAPYGFRYNQHVTPGQIRSVPYGLSFIGYIYLID